MSEQHVKGLAELQKFLDELPAKIEKNIMRSAMRAGAKVYELEVKQRVPVGPPNGSKQYGGYAGALRDSVRVSVRYSRGTVKASVKAGGRTKSGADAFYARWVEYGTAAHLILPKNAKALFFGGHPYSGGVKHPGAVAKPFMRPAFYSQAEAVLTAVGEKVKQRLTKEGIEAAGDIEVGT